MERIRDLRRSFAHTGARRASPAREPTLFLLQNDPNVCDRTVPIRPWHLYSSLRARFRRPTCVRRPPTPPPLRRCSSAGARRGFLHRGVARVGRAAAAGRGHHHGNHAAAVRAARRATPVPGPAFCRAYPLTCGAVTTVSSRSAPAATAQRRRRRRRSTGARGPQLSRASGTSGQLEQLRGPWRGSFRRVCCRETAASGRTGGRSSRCAQFDVPRASKLVVFFSAFSAGFGCIVTPRAPRRSASGVRAGIERDLRKCAARESRDRKKTRKNRIFLLFLRNKTAFFSRGGSAPAPPTLHEANLADPPPKNASILRFFIGADRRRGGRRGTFFFYCTNR